MGSSLSSKDGSRCVFVSLLECNERFGNVFDKYPNSPPLTSSERDGPGDLFKAEKDDLRLVLLFLRVNWRGVDDLESVSTLLDGDPENALFVDRLFLGDGEGDCVEASGVVEGTGSDGGSFIVFFPSYGCLRGCHDGFVCRVTEHIAQRALIYIFYVQLPQARYLNDGG